MKWPRILAALFILAGLASCLFVSGASGASSGNFYSLNSDGTLYLTDANYVTAQTTPSGVVEYTTTGMKVGQDNATGLAYVWRSVFFFDTQQLPEGATVSSAYVTVHGKSNHSTTEAVLQ